MNETEGVDVLHDELDRVAGGLPPMQGLPPGFGARARRRRTARLAAAGLGGAAVLAGVGLGVASALPSPTSTVKAPVATGPSTPVSPPPTQPTSVPSTQPSIQPSTPAPSKSPPPATPGACTTAELTVSLGQAGGAAGSTYYPLRFHNSGGLSCTLDGYPGVSFASAGGSQVGAAATRNPQAPAQALTLAAGATDAALLQVVDAGNYPPSSCAMTTVAALRVYPPGSTASVLVPYPGSACSGQVKALSVTAIVGNATGQG